MPTPAPNARPTLRLVVDNPAVDEWERISSADRVWQYFLRGGRDDSLGFRRFLCAVCLAVATPLLGLGVRVLLVPGSATACLFRLDTDRGLALLAWGATLLALGAAMVLPRAARVARRALLLSSPTLAAAAAVLWTLGGTVAAGVCPVPS